jgi:hypothetical protein
VILHRVARRAGVIAAQLFWRPTANALWGGDYREPSYRQKYLRSNGLVTKGYAARRLLNGISLTLQDRVALA